jgi:ferredoxin
VHQKGKTFPKAIIPVQHKKREDIALNLRDANTITETPIAPARVKCLGCVLCLSTCPSAA